MITLPEPSCVALVAVPLQVPEVSRPFFVILIVPLAPTLIPSIKLVVFPEVDVGVETLEATRVPPVLVVIILPLAVPIAPLLLILP